MVGGEGEVGGGARGAGEGVEAFLGLTHLIGPIEVSAGSGEAPDLAQLLD